VTLRFLPLAVAFFALGCAGELGVGGGAMTETGHAVAFGRSTLSTRLGGVPIGDSGLLLGLAVEGRGEERVGSRFQAGALVGGATPSDAVGGWFGVEGYGEFGTPLRSTLFAHGDKYFAFGAGFPFPLDRRRDVARVNDSTWVLKYRLELVPFVRTLAYDLHDDDLTLAVEVSGGIAFRYRLVSDLF